MASHKKYDEYGRAVHALCLQTNGHDYRSPASPSYQKCCRPGCSASQRLHKGEWVEVLPHKLPHKHEQPQEPTRTLMDECTALITVHIQSVPPSLVSDSVKTWWLN